jgi:hypothetical protein
MSSSVGRLPTLCRWPAAWSSTHECSPQMETLGNYDASRLVHHASEAGDVDALVRYAPDAARDAATSGAHREAAGSRRPLHNCGVGSL